MGAGCPKFVSLGFGLRGPCLTARVFVASIRNQWGLGFLTLASEANTIGEVHKAPVAQLDRVPDYESVGCAFKSRRARSSVGDRATGKASGINHQGTKIQSSAAKAEEYERWMRAALVEAEAAAAEGEVPVGCVVVHEGRIVGRGHNRTEALKDPTAHAEIIAIGAAATALENWRLSGATVYVTIEPCLMCAGALTLARPDLVVYGARDPKFGCLGSRYDIAADDRFNHRLKVVEGVLATEAGELLKEFFRLRRRKSQ
jgi:tRNA(adenine34) deaminase